MTRRHVLLVSAVILCAFAIRSAIGIPAALATASGSLADPALLGGVIGVLMGPILWFGLAYAQWKTSGRWGLGIGFFVLVTLAIQSFLLYLAVHSGRVPWTAIVLVRYSTMSFLPIIVEAISSFYLYATRDRKSNEGD